MKDKNIVRLICGLIMAAYALAGAFCAEGGRKIVADVHQTTQGH